jgi:hypothetical protein
MPCPGGTNDGTLPSRYVYSPSSGDAVYSTAVASTTTTATCARTGHGSRRSSTSSRTQVIAPRTSCSPIGAPRSIASATRIQAATRAAIRSSRGLRPGTAGWLVAVGSKDDTWRMGDRLLGFLGGCILLAFGCGVEPAVVSRGARSR